MTIQELFDLYYNEYAIWKCRSHIEMKENFERYFKDIQATEVTELQRKTIRSWHLKLAAQPPKEANGKIADIEKNKRKDATANRSLGMLRAMINWAVKWEHLDKDFQNPTAGISKFAEPPRKRVLDEDFEMERFLRAVEEHGSPKTKDIFLLCLYTAQRIENVCEMKWDAIDLNRRVWIILKEEFKTNVKMEVPLVDEAMAILERLRIDRYKFSRRKMEIPPDRPYVFPGIRQRSDSHIKFPYAGWAKVLDKAGIKDLQIRDLRRTHASYQNENDTSTVVTKDTLGHTDIATTSKHYITTSNKKKLSAMQGAVDRMKAKRKRA